MTPEEKEWLDRNTAYCEKLQARISTQQCIANKNAAKVFPVYDEYLNAGMLRKCLNCAGIFGTLKVKEKEHGKRGLLKCSTCGSWKTPDEFRISGRTGKKKSMCWKCDDRNARYRKKYSEKPPDPPMLICQDFIQSCFNKQAIVNFNLFERRYGRTYEQDNKYYLEVAEEKKEGFYTFSGRKGMTHHLSSCARNIVNNLKTDGIRTKFIIVPTEDPNIFLLEER